MAVEPGQVWDRWRTCMVSLVSMLVTLVLNFLKCPEIIHKVHEQR